MVANHSAVIGDGSLQALFIDALSYDFFDYFVPIMIAAIILEALASWIYEKDQYSLNDAIMSMSHGFLADLLVQRIILPAFTMTVHCWIYYNYAFIRPAHQPWHHIVAFLGVDFCYYWAHRAGHEVNIFWATHQVHHSSERYNLSTATRQGIVQNYYSSLFYAPLALFLPPPVFYIHKQLNTMYQFWIHTEVIDRFPAPIEYIFNTPSHHRVHHGRNPLYLDKNYGGTLILWDRLFGTFEPESEKVEYGLVHRDRFFNVFQAQFGHYIHVVNKALSLDTLGDKIKAALYGPGWMKGNTRRLGEPVDFIERGDRYGPLVPSAVNWYVSIHSTLFLLIFFVELSVKTGSTLDWALSAYCLFGIFNMSRLLQHGLAAFFPFEGSRILLFVGLDIGFMVVDALHDRSHGIWWSAGSGSANFATADHIVIFILLFSHLASVLFLLRNCHDITAYTASPSAETSAQNTPVAPKTPPVEKSGATARRARSPKGARRAGSPAAKQVNGSK